MDDSPRHGSASSGRWPPAFRGGAWPAVALVGAFVLWTVVSVNLVTWLFGASPPLLYEQLWNVPSGIVQFGIVAAALRYEGVRLRDVGLSTRLLAPALAATAGLVVALNGAVAGLGALAGNDVSFGLLGLYRSPPQNYSLGALAVSGVAHYLFVGPVEELTFRGYLQNKFVATLGYRSSRVRTAVGVVAASVVFSLVHVPARLVLDGLAVGQLLGPLVLLALSGVLFGTVYALTRNLYLVALLHGVGNLWPLVVDPGPGVWPNWAVVVALYLAVSVLYRRWATAPRMESPMGTASS